MIKQTVKKFLASRCITRYEQELSEKRTTYANWYRLHQEQIRAEEAKSRALGDPSLTSGTVRYSGFRAMVLSGETLPDILIACADEGELTEYAPRMIRRFFEEHPDCSLLYGDEDRQEEDGTLCDPWLKSDWAPDTFLSTFYFGSVFAIRTSVLFMINPGSRTASDIETRARLQEEKKEDQDGRKGRLSDTAKTWIYELCLKIAQADGGFSRREDDRFPIGHIREVLFHSYVHPVPWDSNLISGSLTGRYSAASARERLVSIIIPSKDNYPVLKRCIETIEEYTQTSTYELILVDNGSSPACREKVQELVDRFNENGRAVYIYREMPFNFSRMCNLGAEEANGELLLFLNDDIEVRRPGWLSYMSEKAKLPYVGAVGMKLIYPNSDIIQHAGVVNVRVGPIHKLQYCDNSEEWYFGFNKGVRNVIAVTGACLMMRENLFRELGGFDEDRFAVSFNDIDLCYRAYELGYYNVVRNNMYLYHHESLSRGDDRKDEVKSLRLSKEQYALLTSHEALFGVDPFYHPYLTQNPAITKFEIGSEDEMLRHPVFSTPEKVQAPYPEAWTDAVLRLGVEYANSLSDYFNGPFAEKETAGYYVKGYAFVIDADNALYDRKVLFRSTDGSGSLYRVSCERVYRKDIADNLTDQIHDELTGFYTVIPVGSLPAGTYEVGMIAADKTGRQKIVNWSDAKLVIQR